MRKEIADTIAWMPEMASTIASAVEEQGASTREISRNVQSVARGTQQVCASIADVQTWAAARLKRPRWTALCCEVA